MSVFVCVFVSVYALFELLLGRVCGDLNYISNLKCITHKYMFNVYVCVYTNCSIYSFFSFHRIVC